MNKTVIITGAGRGLGFCVAKRHLEMGDTVWGLEYSPTQALEELAGAYGEKLHICPCDVGKDGEPQRVLSPLREQNTPVDIVYNIAGVHSDDDRVPLDETDLSRCVPMYTINAVGPLRVCQGVYPLLHAGSVIINISSDAGSIANRDATGEYNYTMSKAALNMAVKTLQNDLRHLPARVFALHPGWMRTEMGGEGARQSDFSVSPEESAENIVGIALDAENIPEDMIYFTHLRAPLPW